MRVCTEEDRSGRPSALLAPARASRQEGHGLFLGQLMVVWTC
jgi:hypothetical protein